MLKYFRCILAICPADSVCERQRRCGKGRVCQQNLGLIFAWFLSDGIMQEETDKLMEQIKKRQEEVRYVLEAAVVDSSDSQSDVRYEFWHLASLYYYVL